MLIGGGAVGAKSKAMGGGGGAAAEAALIPLAIPTSMSLESIIEPLVLAEAVDGPGPPTEAGPG